MNGQLINQISETDDVWSWMDGNVRPMDKTDSESMDMARCIARIFSHHDSEKVLNHFRKITRERVFSPETSEATLRYVEGQRAFVAYVENMINRGRSSSMQTGT